MAQQAGVQQEIIMKHNIRLTAGHMTAPQAQAATQDQIQY